MPAGIHMSDIVGAAVAAYAANSNSKSSGSHDRHEREYSSSRSYDRSYDRDHHSHADPDPFSELVRKGAHELGRLVRKFEKKAKRQPPTTGQDIYDDRFVEELGSDVEPLPEYYPEQFREQGRSQTIHVRHRDEDEYDNHHHQRRASPPRRAESYPPRSRGAADEYYNSYAEPSYVEQPIRPVKEKKKPSLKSLTKGGLDIGTLLKNLPILLERADRILSMLDSGSRSRSGSKKMNYITALRAAVKLVRALQIGAAGMGAGSSGRR